MTLIKLALSCILFVFVLTPSAISYASVPTPIPISGKCRNFGPPVDSGPPGSPVIDPVTQQIQDCDSSKNLVCLPNPQTANLWTCQNGTPTSNVFGVIHPPFPLWGISYGNLGISQILSRIISIIYAIAALVVVFMFIFGAFEWILSGGDKEKVASAQTRLTSAIIGLVLLAIAFPILSVLGQITGFSFF